MIRLEGAPASSRRTLCFQAFDFPRHAQTSGTQRAIASILRDMLGAGAKHFQDKWSKAARHRHSSWGKARASGREAGSPWWELNNPAVNLEAHHPHDAPVCFSDSTICLSACGCERPCRECRSEPSSCLPCLPLIGCAHVGLRTRATLQRMWKRIVVTLTPASQRLRVSCGSRMRTALRLRGLFTRNGTTSTTLGFSWSIGRHFCARTSQGCEAHVRLM